MRKMLLLLMGVLLFSGQLFSQTRTIVGKVTDDKGNPIPNASVLVKGSSSGTTTDSDGSFSLTVPDNARTLIFSAVGRTRQEISIGSKTSISVNLNAEDKSLEEVVVVGYGRTTKQAYTGSATVVKAEKLNNKSVSNLSQALAGEVAGVRVINPSGQPGTAATIRIRGFGSVNGNRDPLFVVDGVPFTGNISSLNMADVESLTVLKDATATAIYGSRGANGVIVITTRSGRGKSFIEVEGKIGTNRAILPRYDVIKSPEEYIGLAWESMYNYGIIDGAGAADPVKFANDNLFGGAGIGPHYNLWNITNVGDLIDPVTRRVKSGVTRKYSPEDWEDYAFQSSIRSEVNVRMGGGEGRTSYFTSFGYLDDQGYSINTDFKRLSARLNLNHEVRKWLTTSMNLTYANIKSNRNGQEANSNSVFWFVDNLPSIFPLFKRDNNGQFVPDPIFGGNQFDYGDSGRSFGALTNAIADAKYNTDRHDRHELSGNTSMTIKFTKDLSFETRLGVQYYNDNNIQRTNKFYGSAASQKGSLFSDRYEMFNYNWLNMLRYTKRFGDHNLEVLAAHENNDYKRTRTQIFKFNLVSNDIEDFNNAVVSTPAGSYTDKNKLESYFAQVNYDFDGKYYFSASARRDGSSRFVKDKWGNFGSVGAGWVISNEGFMQQQKVLDYLKLKASFGLIGEQNGLGPWPGYDLFNIDNLNDQPAFSFNTKGNPDLTWETSKMFQAGVEFKVKDFLTGTVEYYIKRTEDLIFDRRVGPSIGYALIKVNGGVLKNQGIEFDLTGHILRKRDYYVDLSVNGESFTNELVAMPVDPVTKKEKILDVQGNYGWSTGHSIYDFYMREFAGVDAKTGLSTWTIYYNDANNNDQVDASEGVGSLTQYLAENPDKNINSLKKTTTKTYTSATQFYSGKSAIPKLRGAVSLNAGYKGFDLAVQMMYSFGGYSFDGAYAGLMSSDAVGGNNWHKDIFARWQKEGDVTDVPRLSNDEDPNVSSSSTRWLTKANYLALNNIRLGYSVPASLAEKLHVTEIAFWVSGDNLWFKSKRKGFNPSTSESGASDTYRYSPLSTISAGLRVKF